MSDKKTISDEAWLGILNGSQEADANSPEQLQVVKIRKVLLQEHEKKIAQQEAKYAEERERLLVLLKNKKLLEPVVIKPKTNLISKILQFISQHKNNLIPVVLLISFLAITIPPFLLDNHSQITIAKFEDPESVITKGNPDQFIATQQVETPHQYALNFQQALIKAGLKVNLKKQTKAGC